MATRVRQAAVRGPGERLMVRAPEKKRGSPGDRLRVPSIGEELVPKVREETPGPRPGRSAEVRRRVRGRDGSTTRGAVNHRRLAGPGEAGVSPASDLAVLCSSAERGRGRNLRAGMDFFPGDEEHAARPAFPSS